MISRAEVYVSRPGITRGNLVIVDWLTNWPTVEKTIVVELMDSSHVTFGIPEQHRDQPPSLPDPVVVVSSSPTSHCVPTNYTPIGSNRSTRTTVWHKDSAI